MNSCRIFSLVAPLFGLCAVVAAQDVTGIWIADDATTYYIRQVGNVVWWVGMSTNDGRTFTNAFRGTRAGGVITGEWADVPRGTAGNAGTLVLETVTIGVAVGSPSEQQMNLRVRTRTGGFGASYWRRGGPTVALGSGMNSRAQTVGGFALHRQSVTGGFGATTWWPAFELRLAAGLNGVWTADDGGAYYLREVGNTVWWVGLSADDGIAFTNVFHGIRSPGPGLSHAIAGEWADVPRGNSRGAGALTLNLPIIGSPPGRPLAPPGGGAVRGGSTVPAPPPKPPVMGMPMNPAMPPAIESGLFLNVETSAFQFHWSTVAQESSNIATVQRTPDVITVTSPKGQLFFPTLAGSTNRYMFYGSQNMGKTYLLLLKSTGPPAASHAVTFVDLTMKPVAHQLFSEPVNQNVSLPVVEVSQKTGTAFMIYVSTGTEIRDLGIYRSDTGALLCAGPLPFEPGLGEIHGEATSTQFRIHYSTRDGNQIKTCLR